MRRITTILALFVTVTLSAWERESVWPSVKVMPDFQDRQIAAMTNEVKDPKFNPKKHKIAYLEWFEAPAEEVRNGGCMILISGGGYYNCCDVGLIDEWHKRFTELGFQCVNFVYRTPRPEGLPVWQTAWEDGQRAVRMVRSEAAKRGFDPEKIGTVSMSAGSHLALLLATSSQTPAYEKVDALDDVPCHINWAVVNAPAYVTTDGETGTAALREGYGPDVKISDIFKFDEKTCPVTLQHGGLDPYSPNGSTLVYRELRKRGIPAELHLYPNRGHGAFGLERAVEFMRQMGFIEQLKPEEDLMTRFTSDDSRVEYAKEDVWPEGKMPNPQENQGTPYIEWHIPANLSTTAIQIVYSGGAYYNNNPDGFEVVPIRRYLNDKGVPVVTMRYRAPRPSAESGLAKHVAAWQDLQRAIRLVRSEASRYGLDGSRIGIMGSSAGGHLTLMGVTSSRHKSYLPIDNIDKIPCNVQWGVGIYPAYALTDGADGTNNGRGNDDSAILVPDFSFDLDTAPMLFLHGDADGYSSMGSVKCWEKMRAMGIQSELHTLALRQHCFQKTASPGTASYTWMDRIWEFLIDQGFVPAAAAEPKAYQDSGTTFVKDALQPYVDSGELPGAISVLYKNGVQETCCLGYADVAQKRRIRMDNVYMQCSQTKGFCGVTIAKLVEEGKISLDDPVSKYLPEFAELWVEDKRDGDVRTLHKAQNVLTVRMVMNHTGGFPFETSAKDGSIRGGGWSGGARLRQNAAIAAASPLSFEPGTAVQYSNTGIDIGAAIVEVVTGMKWEDYLKKVVLDPLGMSSSSFWPTDGQLAGQIEMYDVHEGAPATWRSENPSQQRPYNDGHVFASAGAGLWTTAEDQLKFYKMLMNLGVGENGVRILKEETVKSILAVSTRPEGFEGYSLGLSAPETDSENARFGHGGAWGTHCSVNWHDKTLKLWAVQLNGNPRPWDEAREAAAQKFFDTIVDDSGVSAYTGRVE